MQTLLLKENVKDFLTKKLYEVDGHNTIANIQAEEMLKNINLFNQADHFYTLGKAHGDMEGRVNLIKEIVEFFDLSE